MRQTAILITALIGLAACSSSDKRGEAEQIYNTANTLFEQGQYEAARQQIDSLRKVYPNAIDTRKKALALYQNIELHQAQAQLAEADSLLQQVQHNLDYQQAKVDKDKAALRATPEELTLLTRTRMKRDSLRTQCETLGAKIRYIRKKQKEAK